MGVESRRGDRSRRLLPKGCSRQLRKVRLPDGQACWVTPSAGDREEVPQKHTADDQFAGTGKGARCGKSAPAASRGAGSVNPGWEQGRGATDGHLPRSAERAARGRR